MSLHASHPDRPTNAKRNKIASDVDRSGDDAPATIARILPEATDQSLPRHWLSGSMKYEDFQPLTEGGTAELQLCFDRNLRRTVVYKSLHPHLKDSELETSRFLREARVTSMIPHPGTVPVYELGRDRSGDLYFTMKHLIGRDLRSVLMDLAARDRPTERSFPLQRLLDILISAAQTISYAHAQGVIHRDVKPANILVGSFGEVVVLDWGLAKVHGEAPEEESELPLGKTAVRMELTQPGRRYGTPLYMSPEQATGDPNLDERTDVFNLGSVLFEVLTNRNLVWGNDVEEVLTQILERPAPRPRQIAPERNIPTELEAICLKALARDPDDRYPDMNAFAADLIAYRSDRPVSVCRYGWHYRLRHWHQRHQIAMAIIVGLLLGLLLAWLVFLTS